MKIGIISFHNAANHGASLQAYALLKFIEDNGYDCEYIDYQNEFRRKNYDMGFLIVSSLRERHIMEAIKYSLGAPFLAIRKKAFSNFYNEHVKYSKRVYYSPEELSISNKDYDVFISGSDQIWNPHHNGADVSYLLDFVNNNKKKISYSSSLSITTVPENLREKYIQCLSSIQFLSTRELSGVELIKQLTGRTAKLVLDPVFLLDRNDWIKFACRKKYGYNFVFSDTNRPDQILRFVSSTRYPLSKIKHHKLSRYTTLKDFVNPKVKVEYTLSPTGYIQNILEADLVLSASFHCTCFSIILNTPFVCFLTGDNGKDERLKTLLTHFGLTDRIYTDHMTIDDINKKIEWDNVNSILHKKRKDSIDFLINAIKS